VGNDLNSLATFVTKVKTTPLEAGEIAALRRWADKEVPEFTYHTPGEQIAAYIDPQKTRNLSLARARFIKKALAGALVTIESLPTLNAQDFARCVLLRTGQWALDGREKHTPLGDFRNKLAATAHEMLASIVALARRIKRGPGSVTILNRDASTLALVAALCKLENRASLVVTSPPYPGVHVLYHRWQVDGRHETPAPYWIAGCDDGQGESCYNLGDKRKSTADNYFCKSLVTLRAIRQVIRDDGYMIQLVAFSKPEEHLPRYLENMCAAGFTELRHTEVSSPAQHSRIWREVPHRKWHAALNGKTHSANEAVLIHRPT
jgi:hypothetical protein